jgi:type I restriction enzyme S subunit
MERQYKDSGIEWIGIIPKTWAIERMKGLFIERNERNCKGRTLLSVSQYFGIRPKSETDIADSHIAESYDDYKEVYQGDFVMNIMLAWNGSYAVSEYDGMVSPAYCVFKFRKDCCKKYFHYLLRTNGYPTAFKTMSRGVIDSRLRLYPEQFYTFPVIIPSVDEQQRISDYLDAKCGEIDSLIALQEQMIEKLKAYKQSIITEAVTKGLNPNAKLVPSGIDWIGNIPEGWEINKLFNLCTIKGRVGWKGLRSDEFKENSYAYLVTGQDFVSSDINWNNCYQIDKDRYEEDPYIQLSNGDILVTKDGTIGKIAKVSGMDKPACLNSGIFVLKQRKETFFQDYLYWYLSSPLLLRYNTFINTGGTTIIHLYQNVFERFSMIIPPMDEQIAIASYLDKKCSEIDNLIVIKQQKIEKLKDYKKSVIYEAVTGKIHIDS